MRVPARAVAPAFAVLLIGATTAPPAIGFANLDTLIAAHPLHGMLVQYDREIAALRNTGTLAGLRDPAAAAQRSGIIAEHRAAQGLAQLAQISRWRSQGDRENERAALADVNAARRAGDPALAVYRKELARETDTTLRDYVAATAQRNARALAAREQQLREKELTLAFDLARRNAGQRLALRIALQDLHLTAAKRRRLESRLNALSQAERRVVAAEAHRDAGVLAAYRQTLRREGETAVATLAAQLRSKAHVNLALRVGVSRAELASANAIPNLSRRMDAFTASYAGARAADAVAATLRTTQDDLPARFNMLAQTARASATQTASQIQSLQRDRSQLYRSMVAHIERLAKRLADQRGLRDVVVSGARPRGSRDVTKALAAMLNTF